MTVRPHVRSKGSAQANYDLIVLDLDGTLVDSKLDLANSVNFTRQQMGLPTIENRLIFGYIGDGATMLIRRSMSEGLEATELQRALEIFLADYGEHLLDHTKLYPGVLEALDGLRFLKLAVLTNKPLGPAEAILRGLGIYCQFAAIYGGNSFDWKKPHPVGIERILSDTGISRERTMMVGDSHIDIQTGLNASVATCGVTYGFARDSLRDPKPDFLINDLRELLRIVYPHG
ncbi:MAG: HAD-IA family hydrolase [Acidimicrobiia bacterium]|nr:HAD-IA family hydrolase [Acidimicrobiia bacterium]